MEPPPPPPLPSIEQLFPANLPLDPGGLPDGLANGTAQSCAACHYEAHDAWERGAHSGDHRDFLALTQELGMPACGSCHFPLQRQHSTSVQYDQDDASRPVHRDNHGVDLSLASEGVTCAACHLRDGYVVAAHEVRNAPHPIAVSDTLGRSEGCAACHQMSFPGAPDPLYNTYAEWAASPWAETGVQCQDCHLAAAADGGSDHAMPARRGKGLSLLVHTEARELVRGGEPIDIDIVLQNTGAGHYLPTGSPFVGWQLQAHLEARDEQGELVVGGELQALLGQTRTTEPPFLIEADTRLAPFEERRITWAAELDVNAPDGPWDVVVTLSEFVGGEVRGEPIRAWRVPFPVH